MLEQLEGGHKQVLTWMVHLQHSHRPGLHESRSALHDDMQPEEGVSMQKGWSLLKLARRFSMLAHTLKNSTELQAAIATLHAAAYSEIEVGRHSL